MSRASLPIIGITLDHEEPNGQPGSYSKFPWYALRQNYVDAVVRAGGLPVPLSHDPELIGPWLDKIDGLVITGGNFDIDPSLFGDDDRHDTVMLKERRTGFEFGIARGALEQDKPVLGICGGQQALHVILGGSLIQHIPDAVPDCLPHEQPNPRDEPGHWVSVKPGTLLHDIVGVEELHVNSAHHQAAKEAGDGVIINSYAPDGVIEGIEDPRYRYCLGVQWHPEFDISTGDQLLFDRLVKEAGA